jgi:hypothetical protein
MFHGRTKHVDVDFHFVQESEADKLLDVLISTNDHVADGFTKPITMKKLESSRINLNLCKL